MRNVRKSSPGPFPSGRESIAPTEKTSTPDAGEIRTSGPRPRHSGESRNPERGESPGKGGISAPGLQGDSDLCDFLTSLSLRPDSCIPTLDRYREMLQAEARKRNITKYTNPQEIIHYHFIDSLQVLRWPHIPHNAKVIDIGTGPGLPGIPCAIVRPDWHISLLESSKRDAEFLRVTVESCIPGRGAVVHLRAEQAAHQADYRAGYDIVLARAVAPVAILLELSLPFLKPGGFLLAHRGASFREDIALSQNGLSILGGKYMETIPYRLRGRDRDHAVLVFRQERLTDLRYPRNASRIRKSPLGGSPSSTGKSLG
ncbi:MAG TPA: 16S rRNA (guanine(527)-N(7))-methyltransferase RsmG [bacterium]|nr:16S rRNA (guanine(527)-N(7))-methyltransferase RsmG [bacterium]HQL60984.1 16S rRNA (guanine(527)-N(7))-methyltransferase RsmG [bacterium]